MVDKTCTKCGQTFPATTVHFYKHARGKHGVTPRCKPCVNEDNKVVTERMLQENPDRVRAQQAARTRKHYHNNLDASRKKQRDYQAKLRTDPNRYADIQAKKRGGGARLSVEEIEAIRTKQNNLCAICSTPDPTDLDHCHTSGRVRWLLCKHCNRGLGAFKDSPQLLCKAAELLAELSTDSR